MVMHPPRPVRYLQAFNVMYYFMFMCYELLEYRPIQIVAQHETNTFIFVQSGWDITMDRLLCLFVPNLYFCTYIFRTGPGLQLLQVGSGVYIHYIQIILYIVQIIHKPQHVHDTV